MQLNKCHHPVKVSIKIALTNKNFYFVIVYEINFRTCELFHKIEVSTYKRLEKKNCVPDYHGLQYMLCT